MAVDEDGLTPKQKMFCDEYLKSFNGTRAVMAVYDVTDYHTAQTMASDNMSRPVVKAYLAKKMKAMVMGPEEALSRLASIARMDYGQFIVEREVKVGRRKFKKLYLDIEALKAAGHSRMIKSVTEGPRGVTVDVYDASAALQTIIKVLGLAVDRSIVYDMSKISDEQLKEILKSLGHGQTDEPDDHPD